MTTSENSFEDISYRRKRLRYRAWHRGTQEMDIVLGHFIDAHIDQLDHGELSRLENLLDEQDTDLLKWVMGQAAIPDNIDAEMIGRLADFQLQRAKLS